MDGCWLGLIGEAVGGFWGNLLGDGATGTGDPRTDKAPTTTNMITSTKPSSCIPIFTCKETERSPPNISQLSPDHPSEGGYVLKKSSKNSNDITMQNTSRRLKGTNYPTVYMSQLTLL